MENFVEKNTLPFFLLHTNQNRKDGQTHKPNHTNKRPTHIISLCYLRTNERREANDGYFSFQPISVGFLSLFYRDIEPYLRSTCCSWVPIVSEHILGSCQLFSSSQKSLPSADWLYLTTPSLTHSLHSCT